MNERITPYNPELAKSITKEGQRIVRELTHALEDKISMNERIKELLTQAGVKLQARRPYIDEDPDGYLESDNDFFLNNHEAIIRLLEEGGLEKFAELIVRECMSLMKEEKDYYDNPGTYETEKYYIRMDAKADAFDDARSIIKNHFGVEE